MHAEDASTIHPWFYSAGVQRIVMIKPLIAGINWLRCTFSAGGGRSPLMMRAELSLAVCWKQVWRRLLGWHHCPHEWGLIQRKHLFHALSVWDFCLIVHHWQKRLLPFINGWSTSCSTQQQSRTQRKWVYSSRSYYHSGGWVPLSPECSKVSELFVRVYYVCFWGWGKGTQRHLKRHFHCLTWSEVPWKWSESPRCQWSWREFAARPAGWGCNLLWLSFPDHSGNWEKAERCFKSDN